MGSSLRNIWAITAKELRSYFVSPVAWVMMGLFAAIFGAFYVAHLSAFVAQSMQSQFGGAAPNLNVNQQLIRGVLANASVLVLFILPMVTMRTYAEEKRSGTVELLLTSPLTDFEIVLGKFFGAVCLYAALIAVTFIHIGLLFHYGQPDWRPLVAGYLGLLLQGASFIASQATPIAGWPCTPAARPVSSTTSFCRRMAPHQGRSTSRGLTRLPATTMPALAALSLMVSYTLRITLVWRSNCSMRESMISMAGVTYSVASSTSSTVMRSPSSLRLSTKASSTSTRGAMKRSKGMLPGSKNMSSSSVP